MESIAMSEGAGLEKFKSVDGLAWRQVENDAYVFHMEGTLHVLEGEVAVHLWGMIDEGGAGREELFDSVMSRFSVSAEQANRDLDSFLQSLSDAGLLDLGQKAPE